MFRKVMRVFAVATIVAVPQAASALGDTFLPLRSSGEDDVITCEQTFGCISGPLRCAQFYWQGFTVTCFGPQPEPLK